MKRRTLLKQAGTLAAIGAMAGCIGELDSPDGDDPGGQPDSGATDTAGTEDDMVETTDGQDDGTATDGDDSSGEGTDDSDSDVSDDGDAGSPSLQSRNVSTTGTDCGTTSEAAVTFDGGSATVSVDGTIAASDPCHVATVERAETNDGTLTVVVGVAPDDSDACQQCLGQVGYEARFAFADALPSSVEVQHASQGDTTTVTTASRRVQPH